MTTNFDFSVSPFLSTDRTAWFDLWGSYADGYEPGTRDAAIAYSNWDAIINPASGLNALALRVDAESQAIGFAHYVFHPCTKSIHPECYLIDLFVATAFRGKGGGRLLLTEVLNDCRAHSVARVTWITKKDNLSAQALYETMAKGSDWVRYVVETV